MTQPRVQHDYRVKPSDPDAPRYRPKCELPEHAYFADLLAACEVALEDYHRHGWDEDPVARKLSAAIAKAGG